MPSSLSTICHYISNCNDDFIDDDSCEGLNNVSHLAASSVKAKKELRQILLSSKTLTGIEQPRDLWIIFGCCHLDYGKVATHIFDALNGTFPVVEHNGYDELKSESFPPLRMLRNI